MENTDKTIEDVRFDEAFEVLPNQVEDFMWSEEYNKTIDAIQTVASLNDTQKKLVTLAGYDLVVGLKTAQDIGKDFLEKGFTPEQTIKVLLLLNEGVIKKAQDINEFFTPPETSDETPPPTPQEKSAENTVLTSLKERLTTPLVIKPSLPQQPAPQPQKTSTKETVDLYREVPEVK